MSLTKQEIEKRKRPLSTKFFTVIVDGTEYWTTGRSRKEVAQSNDVLLIDVSYGAETHSIPYLGDRLKQ